MWYMHRLFHGDFNHLSISINTEMKKRSQIKSSRKRSTAMDKEYLPTSDDEKEEEDEPKDAKRLGKGKGKGKGKGQKTK